MRAVRTLIVDDEKSARDGLRHLLAGDDDISVVGECGDGRSAVSAIRELEPDLVFLDVQMPELDGFATLRAVGLDRLPTIVFVTAYDRYALAAFEAHAVDYLLKPFTDERFHDALAQAKRQIRQARLGEFGERVAALIAEGPVPTASPPRGAAQGRLVLHTKERVVLLPTDDIAWIDADGDYVRIHTADATHVVRETMHGLEAQLDPAHFVRIHRSTIANLDRVGELQTTYRNEVVAVLHDGTRLKVSRGCRATLESRLGRRI
ncbi:MAG TPA: LytTR family DNA-binding domain-containing protein [Gemmatimonadales bacterium]|nr:LytTR family DNA-binding domain-containing protein [Gemmatimonadales bacterium]